MLKVDLLSAVRSQNPLVLNITNIVVANYVANGLLALGASPIMSNAPEEIEELTNICQALAINIGTLTKEQVSAMITAGKAANQAGKPVLLDPVGVGASKFRRQTTEQLLNEIKFSAIRGNMGEMAMLAGIEWQAKGVDAGSGEADAHAIAKAVAYKYQTVAVISGEVDVISDGTRMAEIANGCPLFPVITGSGCLHGAVCAAFMAVCSDDIFTACFSASTSYAIAGELADSPALGNGGFTTALLDAVASVSEQDILKLAKVSEK